MIGFLVLILFIGILGYLYCVTRDASLIAAIGTVLVSIMAIWGEKIRHIFACPMLELRTLGFGTETRFGDGKPALFYHLELINKRTWAPARNVKILCKQIAKKLNNETRFKVEETNVPLQLTWSPMEFHQITPTVVKKDRLDLGYIVDKEFRLRTYAVPNNFRGFISAGQTLRISLEISADNFYSKEPQVYTITFGETNEVELQNIKNFVRVSKIE